MYDVQSLSGDIVLTGAFETHPLTIRRNVLRENEHYVPLSRPMTYRHPERTEGSPVAPLEILRRLRGSG